MFKRNFALLFGVIAALVVFLTALITDARILVAFLRGGVGFIAAGLGAYVVLWAMEHWKFVGFDVDVAPRPEKVIQEMKEEQQEEKPTEKERGEDKTRATEKEQEVEFSPMEMENLEHMTLPNE